MLNTFINSNRTSTRTNQHYVTCVFVYNGDPANVLQYLLFRR